MMRIVNKAITIGYLEAYTQYAEGDGKSYRVAIWNGKPYKLCAEDNTGSIPPINKHWVEVEFVDNPYLDEVLR